MSNGWNTYYQILLAALIALGLPLSMSLLSFFFSKGHVDRSTLRKLAPPLSTEKGRPHFRVRKNSRILLALNLGLVFMALCLILIPCVAALRELIREGSEPERGFIIIASLSSFILLGLVYCSKKNDLSWIWSWKKNE